MRFPNTHQTERFLRIPSLGRSTGDLTFAGDVEVEGHITDDARLKVTGSVLVRGNVLGGTIETGGDIEVRGVVRNHSVLEAGGDITVRSAELSGLESASRVIVGGDAEFCRIRAGRSVQVGGRILGGHCEADEEIVASSLGGRTGTRTEVVLDPVCRRADEIRRLEEDLDRVRNRLMYLRTVNVQAHLKVDRSRAQKLAQRVAAAEATLTAEFRATLKRLVVARSLSLGYARPRACVTLGVFPGVDLRIDGARLVVRGLLPAGVLEAREGRIHTEVDPRPALRPF